MSFLALSICWVVDSRICLICVSGPTSTPLIFKLTVPSLIEPPPSISTRSLLCASASISASEAPAKSFATEVSSSADASLARSFSASSDAAGTSSASSAAACSSPSSATSSSTAESLALTESVASISLESSTAPSSSETDCCVSSSDTDSSGTPLSVSSSLSLAIDITSFLKFLVQQITCRNHVSIFEIAV